MKYAQIGVEQKQARLPETVAALTVVFELEESELELVGGGWNDDPHGLFASS